MEPDEGKKENQEQPSDVLGEFDLDPLGLNMPEDVEDYVAKMEWPDRKAFRLEQEIMDYAQVPIGLDIRMGTIPTLEVSDENKLEAMLEIKSEAESIVAYGDEYKDKIEECREEAEYELSDDLLTMVKESQEIIRSQLIPKMEEHIKNFSKE